MTILDYISLNSVQNFLVVLGVVDMCHLLLNTLNMTSTIIFSQNLPPLSTKKTRPIFVELVEMSCLNLW